MDMLIDDVLDMSCIAEEDNVTGMTLSLEDSQIVIKTLIPTVNKGITN